MKKIIRLVMILTFTIAILFTQNVYAVSLDNLTVDTDKTTVRPGEEVTLTVNFGENLGAYTFDVFYDHNIFEYVSVDGGTANDTTDKVRVIFYDSTGGSNPRQNMKIIFRAKSDLETSNPTELMVTGEGLANADASVTYDDITTPIVKNMTVEPEYQDYVLDLTHTGDIIAGQEKDMTLSYSSSMGRFYEHARLVAEATNPDGANVKLTAIDSNTQVEEDIIQSGWGNAQGYKIGGKDVSQVLQVKGLFTGVGDYTITLKLIDRDNSDMVISKKQFSFKAVEETTITPPKEEEALPTEPEDKIEPETQNQEKPQTLPKTGSNLFIPLSILLICLLSSRFYYHKNKE